MTCRVRKKGCDKQLPKCGYCSRRGLDCVYHDAPPSHEPQPEHETENELESWPGAFKSVPVKQEAERSRSRGTSLNLQTGVEHQKPVQPPGSRDGLGGITAQLRTANLGDSQGAKRMASSTVGGTMTAHPLESN